MAGITADEGIKSILKVWYKDGVENLLVPRNDPLLKEVKFTKVEGKEQRFAALYSRGGAVSADFLVAKNKAAKTAKNAEFIVTPGQLFSSYVFNAKEVQSSLSKRGAYMKIAGNKFFAANQAFRSTLAATLYGRGYGEIGYWKSATSSAPAMSANVAYTLDGLTLDLTAKIDIDSSIVLKKATDDAELVELVVTDIDETNGKIVVLPQSTYTVEDDTQYVVALKGSMDGGVNGGLSPKANPIMPMGLDAWLPIVNGRKNGSSDTKWTSYIQTPFFGVNRSVAPDRLAGQFYMESNASAKKADSITALLRKVRRAGGVPDIILLNEKDWYDVGKEIETTNTLFTQTSEKGKKKATMGFSDFAAAFSTNWIDNIYDSPYVPEGKFYILDKTAIEYFVYTSAGNLVADGIDGNNPGKQDVMDADNKGHEDDPFKLLIDDVLSVVPGEATSDGESVRASINFFGSLALVNPSNCGVGVFYTTTPEKILGWL